MWSVVYVVDRSQLFMLSLRCRDLGLYVFDCQLYVWLSKLYGCCPDYCSCMSRLSTLLRIDLCTSVERVKPPVEGLNDP